MEQPEKHLPGYIKELPYSELTESIIGSCYDVINELGAGFLESVYHSALVVALGQKAIRVQSEAPLPVYFRGIKISQFFADLLVEEKVIVELKVVDSILPEHKAQVINYLKATGIDVGLLVNFRRKKLEIYRLHK